MPLDDNKYQEALGYWTIGLQYLHLVEVVISETIAQGNPHILISHGDITLEQYDKKTKWSDHNLIIPVLFDFYHGIEIILKGFLVAAGKSLNTTHKLSELVSKFEKEFSEQTISKILRKYIIKDQLPEILSSFCTKSDITIDDYYQALKYPESTKGKVFKHYPLKYKGKEGISFFKELAKDISEVVPKIVSLGRQMLPQA